VLAAQGDYAGALAHHREALDVRRALAAQQPGNATWRNDVAFSLGAIGSVCEAQGDLAGALAAFRESLAVRRDLAARDGASVGAKLDVAFSLCAVGRVLEAQGDGAGALAAYGECLDTRRAASAAEPGNGELRRQISEMLTKLEQLRTAADGAATSPLP
jgi:tetratricopeptide (TPR) repeat protein